MRAPLLSQRAVEARAVDGGAWGCPGAPDTRLSVLTLNVWFSAHEQARRARALVELLERTTPTVVALQEVTTPFLEALASSSALCARYWRSEASFAEHGTVLLSSLPVRALHVAELGGTMGRTMPWAQLEVAGEEVAIGVVHLESKRHNAPTRREQLVEAMARLSHAPHAALVGDLNFADGEPIEEEALHAAAADGWFDAWRALHPHDPGYTRDTGTNPMAAALRNGDLVQRRIDRVLVRSPRLRPTSATLVGTEPIAPGVWLSDHYGLRVELA